VANTGINVQPVSRGRVLRDFIRLPATIYRDDPLWVPPIPFERNLYFSKRNPVFREKEVALWIACRNGRPVGRISAQIDPEAPATGCFGCLESEDDPVVFAALFDTVEEWLAQRGAAEMVGPFSLSINDECGLLVDGFDDPPMAMMPHGRRYYGARCLEQGVVRATDLLAYRFRLDREFSPRAERIVRRARRNRRITLRSIPPGSVGKHIRPIMEIFNDGWSGNWGFDPMSEESAEFLAGQMKHLLMDGMIWMADVDGRPAAIAITIPNFNEALVPLRNGLKPLAVLKFANMFLRKKFTSARTPLMGVRKEFHGSVFGAELALSVIDATRDSLRHLGIETLEISWILEDNASTRHIVEELVGGDLYKRYRIYSKPLRPAPGLGAAQ
jgi:hypothetical protein